MRWLHNVNWKVLAILALFSSGMFFGHPAEAGNYRGSLQGRCVGVTDGDTATILDSDNKQHEIRLFGIDAPETTCHARKPSEWDDACTEHGQPFGKAAKKSLAEMVFGKEVNVELQAGDSYGREIGTIWVGNINANLEQVHRGYAWMWRQYAKHGILPEDYKEMELAEKSAQDHHLGLWSDPHPLEPWEYRHHGGGFHGN